MAAPLGHLLPRWERDPAFRAVLTDGGDGVALPDAVRPFFLAGLAHARDGAVVAVVPHGTDAEVLRDRTSAFCSAVGLLDAWDVLPYEGLSPDPRLAARRIDAFHLLSHGTGARVVVAPVRGLIQKPAPGAGDLAPLVLVKGGTVDLDELAAALADLGYGREDVAADPGTFAVRGGIVDVFGAQAERVVRVELFGDEIESIRGVDPITQRSVSELERAGFVACTELRPTAVADRLSPALERVRDQSWLDDVTDRLERLREGLLPEGAESVLPRLWDADHDHLARLLPADAVVVVLDPERTADEAERARDQEEELASLWADPAQIASDPADRGPRPERIRDEQGVLYLPLEAVLDRLPEVWRMPPYQAHEAVQAVAGQGWEPGTSPRELLERCRGLRGDGWDVVFCALPHEAPAVGTRLAEERLAECPVVPTDLHGGFLLPTAELAVVTHTEWHARPPVPARPKRGRKALSLQELNPGDLIVHALHGIGQYVGMETREVAGFTREYLVCEYHGGDRVYVPSDATDALQRYVGSEEPKLSKLGTADWERTKSRVRKKVRDIAAELVKLYAARMHSPGHAYPESSPWERELEESFPYDETPDQLRAIWDVARDMGKPIPMDRLVCGDVGYGKTEVAVRAAFKAVIDGKQAAVLVPTTLLAQQHLATFSERFSAFPARVGVLSRFVDPQAQERVLAGLASGEIDVVIGTHRLLSKDVGFHDLGLVIVDEEHRFGVSQKERLRKMRVEVDVLTLTATPIPRTLEMSMSGIRDLSVIETAPAARRPIRTFVGPFDERLITAAIRRELARGGQIFYVHNRVQTIDRERRRLERLIPEARIAVGHGQMTEDALEATMLAFWNREVDVLLCTTIIEAGLDIPTVNTLIVDRADTLGLAQLYQLRGRVGRAGEQAYAYLFYPANARLTEHAHERLKTLAQHTDLGSGMAIAMKDLEIRGAGNLLGAEQHGQIEAVGFEMYVQLLEEAAAELKGEAAPRPLEVRIDLPIDAYLPATYITKEPLRLAAYRRLGDALTVEDVADVRAELRDRFGPLPPEAEALCRVAELRADLRVHGIEEVSVSPHELHGRVARLRPVSLPSEWQHVHLRRVHSRAVLSDATRTLLLPAPDADGTELVDWLREAASGLFVRDNVPV